MNKPLSYTEQAQIYLAEQSILFEVKNKDVQLVVESLTTHIDYYPSTDKWIERNNIENPTNGFGLKSLIKYCTTGETSI